MADAKNTSFIRGIGLFTATSIVIGASIGSGIFKKPAVMAAHLGSPSLLLGIWLVAGVMTCFGALSVAEVGAMFPVTGGQYVFFKNIYGKFFGYLYGWAVFSVIQTGSISSITYIFAESFDYLLKLPRLPLDVERAHSIYIPYIGTIFPLAQIGIKLLTILVIFLLSFVNYLGVLFGGFVQNLVTVLKLVAMAALILLALFAPHGTVTHFAETIPSNSPSVFAGIIAALSGAFWAYEGWMNVTYVGGEIKDPQKNLPKALFLGTAIVTLVYVLINGAYLYVLPLRTLAESKIVATTMAEQVFGNFGGTVVALAILLSTFGASNGSILATARVHFAMAREKMFFPVIGKISPRFKTPGYSLGLQAIWCSLLVLSGTFDMLTDTLVFVTWIFYGLAALGVFVLRKRQPQTLRPYRVWGYPFVPASFVIFASIFVVKTLLNDIQAYNAGTSPIINSVFGLCLVAIGVPFYFVFQGLF